MIVEWQWALFIGIEIGMVLALLGAIVSRAMRGPNRVATGFLVLFVGLLGAEGWLAYAVYKATNEWTTFHFVIGFFIGYVLLYGRRDFDSLDWTIRSALDRRMTRSFVTEEERALRAEEQSAPFIRKRAMVDWVKHVVLFGGLVTLAWLEAGNGTQSIVDWVRHTEWFGDESLPQPFTRELYNGVVRIWCVVFAIDTVLQGIAVVSGKKVV